MLTERPHLIAPGLVSCYVHRQRNRMKVAQLAVIGTLFGICLGFGGEHRWIGQSLEIAMGFPGAAHIAGSLLTWMGIVIGCGVMARSSLLIVSGCAAGTMWFFAMGVFALWKLIVHPGTVDDVVWLLYFGLSYDMAMTAQTYLGYFGTPGRDLAVEPVDDCAARDRSAATS